VKIHLKKEKKIGHKCVNHKTVCPLSSRKRCVSRKVKGCSQKTCCFSRYKGGKRISHRCRNLALNCPKKTVHRCYHKENHNGCLQKRCCKYEYRGLKLIPCKSNEKRCVSIGEIRCPIRRKYKCHFSKRLFGCEAKNLL